jgi:hypothetical protein
MFMTTSLTSAFGLASFDPARALRLCRFAQMFYEEEAVGRAGADALGVALVKCSWRKQGATQAGWWEDREGIYLAFCGTNDWTDMLYNGSAVPFAHRWGRVHAGFRVALRRIEDEVLSAVVSRLRAGDRQLWITGHSLGGALAVLMAARFRMEGLDVAGVYTFGQPKTGNRNFQRRYDEALGDRTDRRQLNSGA